MGLSLGAAIILGAILAPTDPVLAGDVGVGPPGDEDEHEPNFALTAEAGLNDGLAFPFVFLGAFVAAEAGSGWIGAVARRRRALRVLAGAALGAAGGYAIAAAIVHLRGRRLDHRQRSTAGSRSARCCSSTARRRSPARYGFLAVFAAGVAFRRYEHGHEMHRRVHDGAEVVEKFCELGLILLLGSLVTLGGLARSARAAGCSSPSCCSSSGRSPRRSRFVGSQTAPRERAFIAWFGVRGIGSLYYVAVALGMGILSADEARSIFWTVAACIVASVIVHGVTAAPLSRRLLSGSQP